MNSSEIRDQIYDLKTDEEIKQFVDKRIDYLESISGEKTVGQYYTDSFKDYISEKIHYKAAAPFGDVECPDLVYDDRTPYYNLVKRLTTYGYNSMSVLNTIYAEINKYLPAGDERDRLFIYRSNRGKRLSIKTIHDENAAFCSERAGLAQNMFKLLGFDSLVVCGKRNGINHAYNIMYPRGYDNEPIVLYDPSHYISYVKENSGFNVAFFSAIPKSEYDKLLMDMDIEINLEKTDASYHKMYQGTLDEYKIVDSRPKYTMGLEKLEKSVTNKTM